MKLPKEKFTLEEKIAILEEGLDPEINTSVEILEIDFPSRREQAKPSTVVKVEK